MHPVKQLIHKKRDGAALESSEIMALVAGVCDDSVTDAQIAAFAMATWFRGMTVDEKWPDAGHGDAGGSCSGTGSRSVLEALTAAGDLVSLILGPVMHPAAPMPMISAGLSHTGGNSGQLEHSRPNIPRDRALKHWCANTDWPSQGPAPADRRIYAFVMSRQRFLRPPGIVS
jgi:thymidine phosphorylase